MVPCPFPTAVGVVPNKNVAGAGQKGVIVVSAAAAAGIAPKPQNSVLVAGSPAGMVDPKPPKADGVWSTGFPKAAVVAGVPNVVEEGTGTGAPNAGDAGDPKGVAADGGARNGDVADWPNILNMNMVSSSSIKSSYVHQFYQQYKECRLR